MFFNWTRWFLKQNLPVRTPIRYRRRPRFIPQVEQLETRLVPSTFTVTNTNDLTTWASGDGSLRGEIQAAKVAGPGSIVNFRTGLTGTINLNATNGTLNLTTPITIDGSGASITVSGQNAIRVFNVAIVTTTINDLTISGGKAFSGGGIYNSRGNLTLTNDTIANNTANFGGGISNITGSILTLPTTPSPTTRRHSAAAASTTAKAT